MRFLTCTDKERSVKSEERDSVCGRFAVCRGDVKNHGDKGGIIPRPEDEKHGKKEV